jgi:hypothetical protein
MALPTDVAQEIRRLLADGQLSQREIARKVNVSRGAVILIADRMLAGLEDPQSADLDIDEASGPPARCPTCGAMVYPPCRLCCTRQQLAQRPSPTVLRTVPAGPDAQHNTDDALALDLHDIHRQRLEEIRTRRAKFQSDPSVDEDLSMFVDEENP